MTKEEIERIRVQMIKHPLSELWIKDHNKWSKEDHREFERLENGLEISKKKLKSGGVSIKVIRLSDGYTYKSLKECMDKNGYHNVEMQQMLNAEIKYKRCEN